MHEICSFLEKINDESLKFIFFNNKHIFLHEVLQNYALRKICDSSLPQFFFVKSAFTYEIKSITELIDIICNLCLQIYNKKNKKKKSHQMSVQLQWLGLTAYIRYLIRNLIWTMYRHFWNEFNKQYL